MSERLMAWVSVAVGASIGAMLGFHHARPSPAHAAPRTAQAQAQQTQTQIVAPALITVNAARAATSPSLAETRPALPAAAPPVEEPAPPAAAVRPPKPTSRSAPPKPKLTPVRAVAAPATMPTSSARFADARRDEELRDPRAVFRAESACARKDPEQCLRAARAFRVGIATKPNERTASIYWHSAQRIYEERCKRREPLSCVGLAAMYEKGPGTQPTYAPALVEHARGICTHRHQAECDELDSEKQRLGTLLEEATEQPASSAAP